MNPTELIRKKRDGQKLTRDELQLLIKGYVDGSIPDYQMSAFLMATYYRGMELEETMVFTEIMLKSGSIVDLSRIPGIKVDKHSTGGVGDKVSIILAPMVAACGVPVPMISGRGLGHTGGTLDKLESIPGFRINLTLKEYEQVIKELGVVMIGQTADIAPADKKMYALRDVTGTVECIPLIAGSIMSKKLAEGIDALVLDIKTGRGAFMQSEEKAIELAKTLIAVGEKFGKKTIGFLTDMNQPLGFAIGNWLEIVECVECLQGKEVTDLMELTYVLGGAMVMLGGKSKTIQDGANLCREAIRSGKAFEKFLVMVKRQGGDVAPLLKPDTYPRSHHEWTIKASTSGHLGNIDALEVGFVALLLGAGRMKVEDTIDPKAGIMLHKKVGDTVGTGDVLATLYTDRKEMLDETAHRLERAFVVTTEPANPQPLIKALIDANGAHPWHSR